MSGGDAQTNQDTPHQPKSGQEFGETLRQTLDQFEQTQKRINTRSGRNLFVAVGIGLLLGLLFLASLFIVKEVFLIFMAIAVGFGAYEFSTALRAQQRDVPRVVSIAAVMSQVFAAYYFGSIGQVIALGSAIAVVVVWRTAELARKSHRTGSHALFLDYGAGILVQVYLGFLLSFAALILRHDTGQWWILAFVVTVVTIDTSALFAGVMWGKHKFVPKISPSKTWEGFGGSLLGGIISAVLFAIFALNQPWWVGVIFGFALVVSATIGDLTESLMKRDLGIKDMSSFLPGHGGFMDRLDSMLPSCLMAYIVFSACVL